MKLLVCLLAISGAVAQRLVNVSDLNADYIQNLFVKRTSRIPDDLIPNACQVQLLYMSKNWRKSNIFPSKLHSSEHSKYDWTRIFQVIDSWGKIPSGLMRGNLFAVGNYEECVNFSTKLQTFGQLEGQYCRAHIPLNSNDREMADTVKLMSEFISGICVPKRCTSKDLQNLLPFKVTKCKSKNKIPFEPLDYVILWVPFMYRSR